MIDVALQRTNMVESQLRPSDITDRRILRAMGTVRREAFLPAHLRPVAYMDDDVRLPGASKASPRALLAPRTLAMLMQLLRVEAEERVLEVGCATGYGTAVLAQIAGLVIGLESDAELARAAVAALSGEAIGNARVVTGELSGGHAVDAPYDAILVSGAIPVPSTALLDQLKDGGRLVAVATGGIGRATVWRRHGMHYDARAEFDASAPLLPGFARDETFSL